MRMIVMLYLFLNKFNHQLDWKKVWFFSEQVVFFWRERKMFLKNVFCFILHRPFWECVYLGFLSLIKKVVSAGRKLLRPWLKHCILNAESSIHNKLDPKFHCPCRFSRTQVLPLSLGCISPPLSSGPPVIYYISKGTI